MEKKSDRRPSKKAVAVANAVAAVAALMFITIFFIAPLLLSGGEDESSGKAFISVSNESRSTTGVEVMANTGWRMTGDERVTLEPYRRIEAFYGFNGVKTGAIIVNSDNPHATVKCEVKVNARIVSTAKDKGSVRCPVGSAAIAAIRENSSVGIKPLWMFLSFAFFVVTGVISQILRNLRRYGRLTDPTRIPNQ